MKKALKIIEAEIDQRELALKHKPLNSKEIEEELNSLKKAKVKLLPIADVMVEACCEEHSNRFYFEGGYKCLMCGKHFYA